MISDIIVFINPVLLKVSMFGLKYFDDTRGSCKLPYLHGLKSQPVVPHYHHYCTDCRKRYKEPQYCNNAGLLVPIFPSGWIRPEVVLTL